MTIKRQLLIYIVCMVLLFTYAGVFVYGQPHKAVVYMMDPPNLKYPEGNVNLNIPIGWEIRPRGGEVFTLPILLAVMWLFGIVYAWSEEPNGSKQNENIHRHTRQKGNKKIC